MACTDPVTGYIQCQLWQNTSSPGIEKLINGGHGGRVDAKENLNTIIRNN